MQMNENFPVQLLYIPPIQTQPGAEWDYTKNCQDLFQVTYPSVIVPVYNEKCSG